MVFVRFISKNHMII